MIRKIHVSTAIKAIVTIITCVLVYHLLIITRIIPYDVVWGGRLTNLSEMYRFEAFSIAINLLILTIVCVKGRILKIKIPARIMRFILWMFVVLFALNTVGNLFAENIWEVMIFTPLTLTLAALTARLALD